jgi:plasmid stabilization system protein ParE
MAAEASRAKVFAAMDALSDQAHIWAPDEDGIWKYILSHFPYTVYYDLSDQRVLVFAVGHQRRKPGYWQSR